MNSGESNPEVKTENFGFEEMVTENIGTENSFTEDDGSESNTLKQITSVVVGSELNVSTLSFLNKMHVVQANFVGQLKTLSNKCDEWADRALKAEAEMQAAEAVIEKMITVTVSEMNTEVTSSEEKSVDFEAVEKVHKVSVVVSPTVTEDEGENWSDFAEREASFSLNYANFGLSPDFRGRNFSDDPIYQGGKYTPRGVRGRGFRGRSRCCSSSHGFVEQRTVDRNELGENFLSSPTERSKIQCCKCKLFGHFKDECREKPAGYLALSKPFSTGTAAEVIASAETPVANKGSKRNKNNNKSKKVVAAVEEKPTEQLN